MSSSSGALLPKVDIHGTWVRSLITYAFGRLCWPETGKNGPGSIEFLVMWEKGNLFKSSHASFHEPKDLMVRPYKPKPWIDNPPQEVVYDGNVRTSEEMSEV